MELKPGSDGGQAKASLPEKKKPSQDGKAAQSAAKRMSLLLEPVSSSGTAEDEKRSESEKFLKTRTLKITQVSKSEKERLIFRISHGKDWSQDSSFL